MSRMPISNAGSLKQRTRNRHEGVAHSSHWHHEFSAAETLFINSEFRKNCGDLKLELIKEKIEKKYVASTTKFPQKKAENLRKKDELQRKHKLSGLVRIFSPR